MSPLALQQQALLAALWGGAQGARPLAAQVQHPWQRGFQVYQANGHALAHTALLTDAAKNKLNTVYSNIQGRVRTLLGSKKTSKETKK